jgi:hypothetical protein
MPTMTGRGLLPPGPALVAGLLAGSVLFFLCFAAIFNGMNRALVVCLGGYLLAGAASQRLAAVRPLSMAAVLSAPAIPWVLLFGYALIEEVGATRAAIWPVGAALAFCLAWVGGELAVRRPR